MTTVQIVDINGVPTLVIEGTMDSSLRDIKLHGDAEVKGEKKDMLWDNLSTEEGKFQFQLPLSDLPDDGMPWTWFHIYVYKGNASVNPDLHILLTECCVELAYDSTTGESSCAGLWEHGERYAKQIIGDLNNWSEGYIDWNLVLDENGGPNHAGNFCEAPIMLDGKGGLVMNPSYWYGQQQDPPLELLSGGQ